MLLIIVYSAGLITGYVMSCFSVARNASTSATLTGDIKKVFFTGKGEVVDMSPPVDIGNPIQDEENI